MTLACLRRNISHKRAFIFGRLRLSFIWVLMCIALSACVVRATPEAKQALDGGETAIMAADLKRVLLLVSDADASLELYRDILGFEVVVDRVTKTDGVSLPAGAPDATTRVLLLKGGEDWLALAQWLTPELEAPAEPRKRLGIGSTALIFQSTDIDARCQKIALLDGVHFAAPLRTQMIPSRNGQPPMQTRGCNFFDVDGHFIEIEQTINAADAE